MNGSIGKSLVILGAVLLLVGLVLVFRDSVPFLRHLGRLPGDIAIQRKNFSFHFPIVTSIIISIILSLILYVISRFR